MADNRNTAKASSFPARIGNTTYIVSVKQSETAKKPIEKVFEDMCSLDRQILPLNHRVCSIHLAS